MSQTIGHRNEKIHRAEHVNSNISDQFRDHLVRMITKSNMTPYLSGVNKDAINALLEGVNDTTTVVKEWMEKIFPRRGTSTRGRAHASVTAANSSSQQRSTRVGQNYGRPFTGRGLRAEAYKKAQDLFCKNRAALADIVLSRRDINTQLSVPPSRVLKTTLTSFSAHRQGGRSAYFRVLRYIHLRQRRRDRERHERAE